PWLEQERSSLERGKFYFECKTLSSRLTKLCLRRRKRHRDEESLTLGEEHFLNSKQNYPVEPTRVWQLNCYSQIVHVFWPTFLNWLLFASICRIERLLAARLFTIAE